MSSQLGTIKNGQIILDRPASFPDGIRVEVFPMNETQTNLGMREEDWPSTPEGITALLSQMDQVETGWLSPDDDSNWRASLRSQKEMEKNQFLNDVEKLRKVWE